jgi:phosphonate transport system substrate-binding protein
MTSTIWVGAVAYDPKVVTIWEGMRRYFHEEAHLPVEVVLFQSHEAQVYAFLAGSDDHAPHIDIGWNTNLAFVQADAWSSNRCRPIALRDTDIGWATKIVAVSGGPVASLTDLRNRTLALGSRDSGHAAILPVHFLEREGLVEQRDYRTLRFNSVVGKHGDTGASEVDVVRAVLDGRADAGAIGSPFWEKVQSGHLVPAGALREIWTSPPYNHCMFTARPDLDSSLVAQFAQALSAMSYDNPSHRPVLKAEGLRRWIEPQCVTQRGVRACSSVRSRSRPEERGVGCEFFFSCRRESRAIEERCQAVTMLAFAFERPAHGGKGLGEWKNFGGDQQIGVLGPDRMPIDPVRRDGDFRQQIREPAQRPALRNRARQRGGSPDPPRQSGARRGSGGIPRSHRRSRPSPRRS